MKKQATLRVLTAVAVLFCAGSAAQAALTWDFNNPGGNLAGWTVLNGFNPRMEGNGIEAAVNATGGRAHDSGHPTLLLESPAFNFTGTSTLSGGNAIRVLTDGGAGDQGGSTIADPANPAAVTSYNGGNANGNGLKGVALLNVTSGQYERYWYDPGNGGSEATQADNWGTLSGAGATTAQQYRLHIFENDSGSWGWTRWNLVEVDGAFGPVTDYVGGDDTIGSRMLDATRGNETFGGGITGARVVKVIQNTANRPLQLAEVEVIELGAGNVAPSGTATQSSTLGPQYPASNAIDGNTGNFQHTNNGVGQWWQVELAADTDLDKLTIWSRIGCCSNEPDRTADIQVQIFGDVGLSNMLFDQRVLGIGISDVRDIPLAALLSADLSAELTPFDAGAGYTYVFDIGSQDQLIVDNPDSSVFTTFLNLNDAALEIRLWSGGAPLVGGETFQLLVADNITGNLNDIILPTLPTGLEFDTSGLADGGDGTLKIVSVIPEPMTMLAIGLGISGLGGYIRKRRRA